MVWDSSTACVSAGEEAQGVWSSVLSLRRTTISISAGSTPMAPLMTESLSVTSLSARTTEAALSPVCLQAGWVVEIKVAEGMLAAASTVVTNATIKSFGVSPTASTLHGLRFTLVSEVKGKAAITTSPAWNITAGLQSAGSGDSAGGPRQSTVPAPP